MPDPAIAQVQDRRRHDVPADSQCPPGITLLDRRLLQSQRNGHIEREHGAFDSAARDFANAPLLTVRHATDRDTQDVTQADDRDRSDLPDRVSQSPGDSRDLSGPGAVRAGDSNNRFGHSSLGAETTTSDFVEGISEARLHQTRLLQDRLGQIREALRSSSHLALLGNRPVQSADAEAHARSLRQTLRDLGEDNVDSIDEVNDARGESNGTGDTRNSRDAHDTDASCPRSTRNAGPMRQRLRLGLVVPTGNGPQSQLRTPLNVRGPQTPNPATALIAHDPAIREDSLSPTSPEVAHGPSQPESKPFGRYTPSYLYHGAVFKGTQRSDRQEYKVEVKIQHVDMDESFMCGFLKIEGLTEDHPTLETYFEGEIIGSKYTFTTRHPDWGASERQDMLHWNRFGAWKPLARSARAPDFSYRNFAEREHIFMRWKEHFLVPDHNVRAISGASFEGFYYICFNQRHGSFSGIYYHSRSENNRWQQLELQHDGHMGQMAAVEFR